MKLTEEELDKLLSNMDLDAPSMSFTRNVMDQLEHELKPVPLSTRVDKRVIYSIAAVFILAVLGVLTYMGTQTELKFPVSDLDVSIKINVRVAESTQHYMLMAFIFIDLIIALFYFDRLLRRKLKST